VQRYEELSNKNHKAISFFYQHTWHAGARLLLDAFHASKVDFRRQGILIVIIAATEFAGKHSLFFQQDVLSGNSPKAFLHLVATAFGVYYLDAFGGIDVYEVGKLSFS